LSGSGAEGGVRGGRRGRPLLSVPVSSVEGVAPLVRAGADQFYCGLVLSDLRSGTPTWASESGREQPEANLAERDLPRLLDAAHAAGRPLIVAMNRMYPPEVLTRVEAAVAAAVEAGADGLVVADLSILAFVRRRWPRLHVTASTYLGLHNRAALALAARCGFDRVVVPRPMRTAEIRALAAGPGPDLEVFLGRERCRYVNAYCHLEHSVPTPDGLDFASPPLCTLPMTCDGGTTTIDDGPGMLEACGLCMIARLRRVPRVGAFKLVGRGFRADALAGWVETARAALDGDLATPGMIRDRVASEGRIRCSVATCYYPDLDPPRAPRSRNGQPASATGLAARAAPVPDWAAGVSERFWSPPDAARPGPLPDGVDGLYLGSEACVHLLPSPAVARAWGAFAPRIVLALPPLLGAAESRRGLRLAAALASTFPGRVEVTANDLGTLGALRDLLPPGTELALGRVFVPQRVDPRLRRFGSVRGAGMRHALPEAHLAEVARICGARRAELSASDVWPAWGGGLPDRWTAHAGPVLLSVSRACTLLARAAGEVHGGMPYAIPTRCDRPCAGVETPMALANGGERFVMRGNALLAPAEPVGAAPPFVDRVVLHG